MQINQLFLMLFFFIWVTDGEDFGQHAYANIEITGDSSIMPHNNIIIKIIPCMVPFLHLLVSDQKYASVPSNKLWIYFDGKNTTKTLPCDLNLQLNGPGEHIIGVKTNNISLCSNIYINGTLNRIEIDESKKMIKECWSDGKSRDYPLIPCRQD